MAHERAREIGRWPGARLLRLREFRRARVERPGLQPGLCPRHRARPLLGRQTRDRGVGARAARGHRSRRLSSGSGRAAVSGVVGAAGENRARVFLRHGGARPLSASRARASASTICGRTPGWAAGPPTRRAAAFSELENAVVAVSCAAGISIVELRVKRAGWRKFGQPAAYVTNGTLSAWSVGSSRPEPDRAIRWSALRFPR